MVQRIDVLIPGIMKQAEKQHAVLFSIQREWPKLVGKPLAAHTKPVSLRYGRLVVQVDSPGDGFALNYQRTRLLDRVRASTDKVKDVVIRPGRIT